MATVTKVISQFTDPTDGSQCVFEYDYDDALLRVQTFRCINNCPQQAYGWVARSSNQNVNYEATFQANSTFEVAVSQGAANRLQLTVTPSGKLDGLEVSFRYPALQ